MTIETFPTQPWVLHALLVKLPTLCKCNTKSSLSLIWWVEVKTHTTRNVNSSVPLNFLTLNISFMLLSMNTTIRSSFSFGRDLLWRTALVKDLFTVSLFSIWGSNSTSLMSACRSDDFQCWDILELDKNALNWEQNALSLEVVTSPHLLVQFYLLWVSCQSHEYKQPAQLVSAGGRQQLQTQLQSLKSCAQLRIHWQDKRDKQVTLRLLTP